MPPTSPARTRFDSVSTLVPAPPVAPVEFVAVAGLTNFSVVPLVLPAARAARRRRAEFALQRWLDLNA